jgi:hypothetical protein
MIKKKYKTKKSRCKEVGYEMRIYDRSKREKLLKEQDQINTIPMLEKFYETVEKKSGWVDMVDCFIIAHLFETYYPNDIEFLGEKPIEEQIKIMWDYLKSFKK